MTDNRIERAKRVWKGAPIRKYMVFRRDTLEKLADRYLGSSDRAWEIANANGFKKLCPGMVIWLPEKVSPEC